MNFYLMGFALYSALISPVSLHWSLRVSKHAALGTRLRLAGLPLMRRRAPNDKRGERPIREREVAKSLGNTNMALLRAALSRKLHRRLRGMIRLERLMIHARFSFDDACKTALWYASARELLRTLSACLPKRVPLDGHITADFTGEGTEVLMRGIISARLGSLALAAFWFGRLYLRERAEGHRQKEEKHAASH